MRWQCESTWEQVNPRCWGWVDKRQLLRPGSPRGQLPLCGGLCYPRTPSACAHRSCSALLQALARTGASAGRRTVKRSSFSGGLGGSRLIASWTEAVPLRSHLLHNFLNAISLCYSSRLLHWPPLSPSPSSCSILTWMTGPVPNSELKDGPPCPHQLRRACAQGPTGILYSRTLHVPSTGPGSWEPNESKLLDKKQ